MENRPNDTMLDALEEEAYHLQMIKREAMDELVRCVLSVVYCLLFAVCCLIFAVCCLLCTVCCGLSAVYCLLCAV
jgi:hypothetical protein